ncbi:hypothetical protein N0V94_007929 [Neodidymelliopsis sp. IMI 364377]|nr:hypothetical protein N0V94_007929 [Neodidymelliopsis sp. IMI 364377]
MHPSTPLQRPRKRRAINACISCRSAKVRCDGTQPCKRCDRNDAFCQYYDAAGKDLNMIRIEKLEAEVKLLQDQLNNSALQSQPVSQTQITPSRTVCDIVQTGKIFAARSRDRHSALERGLITYDDAFAYFTSFFAGSHYLVPIFSEDSDSIASVASRSAYLFDAIVSVGCRAEQGFHSATLRQLQNNLREHLTALLVSTDQPKLEDVQAITLMAAYSDSGYFLIALALRFAIQLGLHEAVDQLLYGNNNPKPSNSEEEELYRVQPPTYLNTFKWTMDYVWAKGAFSILLVLRLAILLRDPVAHILSLLRDAHRVLEELKKVTTGHIPYFQILQTSIEKCEAAITDYSQTGTSDTELTVSGPAESDFQGYAPNQFTFEWDFPGLNLKHMPLRWQDLFVDVDNLL